MCINSHAQKHCLGKHNMHRDFNMRFLAVKVWIYRGKLQYTFSCWNSKTLITRFVVIYPRIHSMGDIMHLLLRYHICRCFSSL